MRARLALAAAAAATLVGCGGGAVSTAARPVANAPAPTTVAQTGVSNGLAAVAGEYMLITIDDHALPYAHAYSKESSASAAQAVSGTLSLKADGTFAMSTTYRAVDAQGERRFDGRSSGACARDGDAYRLYWDGGGETALTVRGDTLAVTNDGVLFKYLKRA